MSATRPVDVPVNLLAVSVPQAAKMVGVTPQHLYRMRSAGLIRFASFGRRTLVPVAELERILAGTAVDTAAAS